MWDVFGVDSEDTKAALEAAFDGDVDVLAKLLNSGWWVVGQSCVEEGAAFATLRQHVG